MGFLDIIGLRRASDGQQINPATEESVAAQTAAQTLTASLSAAGTFSFGGITNIDISKVARMSLRTSGTFSATVVWEVSYDGGTTWDNWNLDQADTTAVQSGSTSTTSSGVIFTGPIAAPLLRIRVSSYTSGTITVNLFLSALATMLPRSALRHTDRATFTDGSSAGTPIMGVYNETPTADPTEDQAAVPRITAKRAMHTNLRKADGTEINPATEATLELARIILNELRGSTALPGLSFVETVATTYETLWVDISKFITLGIAVEMEPAETATGEVYFTNAADPNVTPPGASDIEKPLVSTLAGSALGGLDKAGFDVPCATWRWAKFKVTAGVTGSQVVKVTTRGFATPASMGILPIASAVTKDYGAALMRGVVMGVDSVTGQPGNVKLDSAFNLYTRNTPNPLSSAPGRTPVVAYLDAQTADALLHTVTATKTLYVSTLIIGIVNTATAAGRILVRDGTTTAGTGKLPLLTPPAGTGLLQSAVGPAIVAIPFPEPIKFTAGVFMDILAGTLTYSVALLGYEE